MSEKDGRATANAGEFQSYNSWRPCVLGREAMVVSGHYLASLAGWKILEDGGNAVDAGIAVGLATNVLESIMTGIGGVAPCLIYSARQDQVVGIAGVGTFPKAASEEYYLKNLGGRISGVHACVVPGAMDAWLLALSRYGTMTFGEVAQRAIALARDGFPVYAFLKRLNALGEKGNRKYPANAKVYLPNDRIPEVGEIFVQEDLGRVLQFLADEEKAASGGGRQAGIEAARDAFYKGDIARKLEQYQKDNGGWLTYEDISSFRSDVEIPSRTTYKGMNVFAGGAYCQGPSMLEALNILANFDMKEMGHNSVDYIHVITEAIKLVAADRHAYIADPKFVDVPLAQLLSPEFARQRASRIRMDAACPTVPEPGGLSGIPSRKPYGDNAGLKASQFHSEGSAYGTSFFSVMDKDGNVFAATPSDGSNSGVRSGIVPGLGFPTSHRGVAAWADGSKRPATLAPGKRPHMTMGPAMAFHPGKHVTCFGTPGTDVQPQAMIQTLLAVETFGMDPQVAVEQPRFASYSFPGSFEPHDYFPARLNIESSFGEDVAEALRARGHDVQWWPDREWLAGSMCYTRRDLGTNVMAAGADPRRTAYAIGR